MQRFGGRCSLTQSPAFRAAALRSEQRRSVAVLGVVVLAFAVGIRSSWPVLSPYIRATAIVGIGLLAVLQLTILWTVRWVRRRQCNLPEWFLWSSTIVECLVPTAMMAVHILSGSLPPYTAMSSPPLLAYGLMVSLMTLRLRPGLCVFSGLLCAGGYGGILAYVTLGMKDTTPSTGLPWQAYFLMTAILFLSGLAAAWVARELRMHMEAALREADTRRRMEHIEQEMEVAQSIQRALLPRSAPSVPGFEIAGWNRPAAQTGGDYYDWQQLPDGNWMITLADVSGHGVGPALVTAACRAYVRASGSQHADLGSLTRRINRLLADDLVEGRFVTMVSVLIESGGGPLALLSAGHAPIVLYLNATGDLEDILPGDMPLAIDPEISFGPAQPVEMNDGDVLALVTDGFIEWAKTDVEGNREQFGLQRLRDSLRRNANLPALKLIEAITADVANFAGQTPQQDDLTMVVIRRTGNVQ